MKSNFVISSQFMLALLATQVISAPLPDSKSLQARNDWCEAAGQPCIKKRESAEIAAVPEIEPVEDLEARNDWCYAAGQPCIKKKDTKEVEAEKVPEAEPVEDLKARNDWCEAAGQPCI